MKVRYSEPSLKQLRKIGKPEAKKQRQGFGRKLEWVMAIQS